MKPKLFSAMLILMAFAVSFNVGKAADKSPPGVDAAIAKGIDYLKTAQAADGSFSAQATPSITAMCAYAMLQNGRSPDDPLVAKSLKYLTDLAQKDGGLYRDKSR